VIEAVRSAVVTRPADAASYIVAACQTNAGKRQAPNRQEALEARNRKVADEMIAEMAEKTRVENATV
jgi:GTP cyclohydrolase III